ncbi:MAG: transporter, partial [Phycisphaeraceae bacterium]|nr:transporter [Phycisphaeraceae bacterium]
MPLLDILVFVGFVACVIALGLIKSGNEKTGEDYFLAGRGLTWWLVGFSLIAANISTEQFVGMTGKAADWLGMAIASYEWMAAITLVIVAFVFLPTFLKSGIYTIPEFLEYRYNPFARTIMAISTLIILVGVPTASVIFSGAKVISVFFQDVSVLGLDLGNITVGCWIIGTLAA